MTQKLIVAIILIVCVCVVAYFVFFKKCVITWKVRRMEQKNREETQKVYEQLFGKEKVPSLEDTFEQIKIEDIKETGHDSV